MSDETVFRRREPASYAYLFWLSGIRRGEHTAIRMEGSTIGRGEEADIVLDDETVSAEQARIRKEGESWYLYDLASTNTTTLADGSTLYRHELSDRDRVVFGDTEMMFRVLK